MKKVKPINSCVHDRRYLNQDAGGDATMLGGDSAIVDTSLASNNSGLGICTCVTDYNVNTGAGGAPLDTQSLYVNQNQFPNGFDNTPTCNQTCKCTGFCVSGLAKSLSNLAPGLIKALSGSKTAATGTKASPPTSPTPAKPISTEQYVIGGVVVLGVFILIAVVASKAIGGSKNSSDTVETAKA